MKQVFDEEKFEEYQQVAALVCLDVDILLDISQQPDITLESLKKQIELLHQNKETFISSADDRKRRYNAFRVLFGAAQAGLIKEETI